MQTEERVQQQIEEMRRLAELRLGITEEFCVSIGERKMVAERDLTKFRALADGFVVTERFLLQRQEQAVASQPPISQGILDGIQDALDETRRILRQVQDSSLRQEGFFTAFSSTEEGLKQHIIQTTARIRGLEVQGSKAVGIAQRPEEPLQESLPEVPELEATEAPTSQKNEKPEKAPIGSPRHGAPKRHPKK